MEEKYMNRIGEVAPSTSTGFPLRILPAKISNGRIPWSTNPIDDVNVISVCCANMYVTKPLEVHLGRKWNRV